MEDGKKTEPLSDEAREAAQRVGITDPVVFAVFGVLYDAEMMDDSVLGQDWAKSLAEKIAAVHAITDLKDKLLIKEGALEIQGGELALATDEYAKMQARAESAEQENKRLRAALERADQFITNGIDLGFIRMPDRGSDDPALETPDIVRAALKPVTG